MHFAVINGWMTDSSIDALTIKHYFILSKYFWTFTNKME